MKTVKFLTLVAIVLFASTSCKKECPKPTNPTPVPPTEEVFFLAGHDYRQVAFRHVTAELWTVQDIGPIEVDTNWIGEPFQSYYNVVAPGTIYLSSYDQYMSFYENGDTIVAMHSDGSVAKWVLY